MKFHYPFKHFKITQKWGVPNPQYEKFGFTRHNGIDAISFYHTPDYSYVYAPKKWPIYCPVENFTVQMLRDNPDGGGKEIWLVSNEKLQIGDKLCNAYLGFAHNEHIFLKVGDTPALGEMMTIGDNTGAASSGAHSHFGFYRVEWDGRHMVWLDDKSNGANGSHDPEPYFTGEYAVDKANLQTLIKSNWRYYLWYAGLG